MKIFTCLIFLILVAGCSSTPEPPADALAPAANQCQLRLHEAENQLRSYQATLPPAKALATRDPSDDNQARLAETNADIAAAQGDLNYIRDIECKAQ